MQELVDRRFRIPALQLLRGPSTLGVPCVQSAVEWGRGEDILLPPCELVVLADLEPGTPVRVVSRHLLSSALARHETRVFDLHEGEWDARPISVRCTLVPSPVEFPLFQLLSDPPKVLGGIRDYQSVDILRAYLTDDFITTGRPRDWIHPESLFRRLGEWCAKDGPLDASESASLELMREFLGIGEVEASRHLVEIQHPSYRMAMDFSGIYDLALSVVLYHGVVDDRREQVIAALRTLLGVQDSFHEQMMTKYRRR